MVLSSLNECVDGITCGLYTRWMVMPMTCMHHLILIMKRCLQHSVHDDAALEILSFSNIPLTSNSICEIVNLVFVMIVEEIIIREKNYLHHRIHCKKIILCLFDYFKIFQILLEIK